MEIIKIPNKTHYLGEVCNILPTHRLINKGITGCGGTTVELKAERNSIILCPTRNLVTSKSDEDYLGITGDTSNKAIKDYIYSEIKYKKLIATYDSLSRIMEIVPNYSEYFLLVDEYHLLFNDYSFRSDVILFILNNFRKFKDWAFLTATPLKEEFILEELKDIPQLTYEWEGATKVNINIRDTCFIQKELLNLLELYKDRNLHIFLNSVSTIYKITEKLNIDTYRVVCSENSKTKIKNFAKINSPIKKYNFYTSCSFEGCDIYDPDGYCIIMSDTNISTTILDISTKIRQVCGRLRDSKYKDQCTLILNTSKHRYAGTNKEDFLQEVEKCRFAGNNWCRIYNNSNDIDKDTLNRSYNKDTFATMYVRKYRNNYFYDENLRKMDLYNYNLINEIYDSSISVITECSNYGFIPVKQKVAAKGLTWIIEKLKELNKYEYTYDELESIFEPLFKEHNLKWNKNTSIKIFFPEFEKTRRQVKGIRSTIYKFK